MKETLWSAAGRTLASAKNLSLLVPGTSRISPLSYAQRRLWMFYQIEPETGYFNEAVSWQVNGEIDRTYWQGSLDCIIRRHEVLRTTFREVFEDPESIVGEDMASPVEVIDLSAERAVRVEDLARHRAMEFIGKPFDLATGPLLRSVIIHTGKGKSLIVVAVHQAVFDGISGGILAKELGLSYTALANGTVFHLPDLRIQFSDFSRWEKNLVESGELDHERQYWSATLRKQYTPLPMIYDYRPEPVPTSSGNMASIMIPYELTASLIEVAQEENCTLFGALIGIIQVLLYQRTKAEDVIVFCSYGRRSRPEFVHNIGLFANVLPVRVDFSGKPSFREVLRRAGAAVQEAWEHQMLPLEVIIEMLKLAPGTYQRPAVQVMVTYQNRPLPTLELPGAVLTPLQQVKNSFAKLDFLFDLVRTPSGVEVNCTYRADAFQYSTIMDMLQGLLAIASSFIHAAGSPPSQSHSC